MDQYPRPSAKRYWMTHAQITEYLSLLKKRYFELNEMKSMSSAPTFMRNTIYQTIQELEARLNK